MTTPNNLKPEEKKTERVIIPPEIEPSIPQTEFEAVIPEKKPTEVVTVREEKYIVIKRIVKKYSWIPLVVALIANLLKGFGLEDKYIEQQINGVKDYWENISFPKYFEVSNLSLRQNVFPSKSIANKSAENKSSISHSSFPEGTGGTTKNNLLLGTSSN